MALFNSNAFRTAVALIGVGVSVCIYFLNRKRKSLTYSIARNHELLKINGLFDKRIEIFVDGKPVQGLSLVIIDIENSGNESIRSSDFEKPLTFIFDGHTEIISARTMNTKPHGLEATIKASTKEICLKPLLLNGGDSFSIEVMLTAPTSQISHLARIVGIKTLRKSSGSKSIFKIIGFSTIPFMVGSVICAFVGADMVFDWLANRFGFWIPMSTLLAITAIYFIEDRLHTK